MPKSTKWNFRDVSLGLQKIRDFLLGRKHVGHNRFPPLISPRSIPPPDIPRGPEYKYSNQNYGMRNVLQSVKPPVVAPVAEGRAKSSKKLPPSGTRSEPDDVSFACPPTPGMPWWWDSHCYYSFVKATCDSSPPPPTDCSPCPPRPPSGPEQASCPKPKKPPVSDPCEKPPRSPAHPC